MRIDFLKAGNGDCILMQGYGHNVLIDSGECCEELHSVINRIMNHYIQGTSSLIFKQALIDVYNQFHNNAELLIPMHDAALYMVDSSIDTNSIINTFKNAFTKWIPN